MFVVLQSRKCVLAECYCSSHGEVAEDESVPSILTVTFITSDILVRVRKCSTVRSLPLFSLMLEKFFLGFSPIFFSPAGFLQVVFNVAKNSQQNVDSVIEDFNTRKACVCQIYFKVIFAACVERKYYCCCLKCSKCAVASKQEKIILDFKK